MTMNPQGAHYTLMGVETLSLRMERHVANAALVIHAETQYDQIDTNDRMFRNLFDPLVENAKDLRHVTLLQGTKAYGAHFKPIEVPARENRPRDNHENFYWLQEDWLKAAADRHGFGWTILRPQLILGRAHGAAMNLIPVLGAHAAQYGVPLLYEPLNRYETNLLNRQLDAAQFLEARKVPNVKLLCDLFHMNIEEVSNAGTLLACGRHVGHVHFADSNRQAIGFGHTETASVVAALKEIGFAGYLSGEILPLPDSEAAAAQTIKAIRVHLPR